MDDSIIKFKIRNILPAVGVCIAIDVPTIEGSSSSTWMLTFIEGRLADVLE